MSRLTSKVIDLLEPLTSPDQPPKALLVGVALIVRLVPQGPLQLPPAVPPGSAVTVSVHVGLSLNVAVT